MDHPVVPEFMRSAFVFLLRPMCRWQTLVKCPNPCAAAHGEALSITVALELRASERISGNGFQGSGLLPPAPPRLPYMPFNALIK